MVKVTSITAVNPTLMEADVFLIADSREEVTANPEDAVGMPAGYSYAFGSKVMTTSKELAILKSDNTWDWGD